MLLTFEIFEPEKNHGKKNWVRSTLAVSSIDDYTKDGGPGAVWRLCSFYHDP